jgi:hypothetical protein
MVAKGNLQKFRSLGGESMKCTCCGEKIKGEPVWIDNDPYCCDECADMEPAMDDDIEEEDEEK